MCVHTFACAMTFNPDQPTKRKLTIFTCGYITAAPRWCCWHCVVYGSNYNWTCVFLSVCMCLCLWDTCSTLIWVEPANTKLASARGWENPVPGAARGCVWLQHSLAQRKGKKDIG